MNQLKLPDPQVDPEDDGMLRMSILEHLEELRTRIIRALIGFGVAFLTCMFFGSQLWRFVQAPGVAAFKEIGSGRFVAIGVMEKFSIIYVWTPLVAAIFVAFPWVIYQVWAFISPGLYPRERKWAVPFIACTGGLFLCGGLFAYFVAFRYTLVFLFGIGEDVNVTSLISIDDYFTNFVNVMLGISVIFELPVLIFFLTLLRVASPSFLIRHSDYAILAIVILAAVITPSPDAFTLTLFAVPMLLLYFFGVFVSYMLVLRREGRKFPWKVFLLWLAAVLVVAGIGAAYTGYWRHLVK
jgi:sec-independent protein translocase protein TatC